MECKDIPVTMRDKSKPQLPEWLHPQIGQEAAHQSISKDLIIALDKRGDEPPAEQVFREMKHYLKRSNQASSWGWFRDTKEAESVQRNIALCQSDMWNLLPEDQKADLLMYSRSVLRYRKNTLWKRWSKVGSWLWWRGPDGIDQCNIARGQYRHAWKWRLSICLLQIKLLTFIRSENEDKDSSTLGWNFWGCGKGSDMRRGTSCQNWKSYHIAGPWTQIERKAHMATEEPPENQEYTQMHTKIRTSQNHTRLTSTAISSHGRGFNRRYQW